MRTAGAEVVGDLVRTPRRGDIRLQHDQVRGIHGSQIQSLHMLVVQFHLIVWIQIAGQRSQAQRRKQRVLDRPEQRTGRLGKRRQDHRHAHHLTIATSRGHERAVNS
jgi:hypothetical protein